MQHRFLRVPDVKKLTGLSRSTIYANPTFPRSVKIGERAVGWVEQEVLAWIDARVATRDRALRKGEDEVSVFFDPIGGRR
jgi:prophage regulatory protein